MAWGKGLMANVQNSQMPDQWVLTGHIEAVLEEQWEIILRIYTRE